MAATIILVFAFVLLIIQAFRPVTWPSGWPIPHLGWLGVALFVLTFILGGAGIK
jgi:hypothetical protein